MSKYGGYQVREVIEGDVNYLIDIDIKCFDNPEIEAWPAMQKTHLVHVATYKSTPVGLIVYRKDEDGLIEIRKLAVKHAHRKLGLSQLLLDVAIEHGVQSYASGIYMILPERTLNPGQPEDLSLWARACGFRAELPFLKNFFLIDQEYQDGVKFSGTIGDVA